MALEETHTYIITKEDTSTERIPDVRRHVITDGYMFLWSDYVNGRETLIKKIDLHEIRTWAIAEK